ncbi:MAG TPA: DUF4388 domain-containing protein [Thermoanaerobaculia bacterium]|nr:DUF4388 domain-containing protein [Thermoanaerobaculia bacterium]
MTTTDNAENAILEGRLEDIPLVDILQVLQVSGKSGALFLRRGDGHNAVVAFRNGHIVQAIGTESYTTFGDRLVARGVITRIDLQEALDYMAHFPGMRIGDALVERGALTRPHVESEVKAQIAETIERLMNWVDCAFEFRVGLVSLGRGMQDFAIDVVLEKGIEPRHVLLEASLLQDKRNRERQLVESAAKGGEPPEVEEVEEIPPEQEVEEEPEEDEEAKKIIRWFDEGAEAHPAGEGETDETRTAETFLSLSEELFFAQGRGEIGLLLLRYASDLYADGGLVLKDRDGFRVLGQFGEAFWWGTQRPREPKTHFGFGESPLFDSIGQDKRPYAGVVTLTPAGGLAPSNAKAGGVAGLAIPLIVLGNVSLILFCRTAVAGAPDARALIALARQVSVTLENITLRELAKRSGMQK